MFPWKRGRVGGVSALSEMFEKKPLLLPKRYNPWKTQPEEGGTCMAKRLSLKRLSVDMVKSLLQLI